MPQTRRRAAVRDPPLPPPAAEARGRSDGWVRLSPRQALSSPFPPGCPVLLAERHPPSPAAPPASLRSGEVISVYVSFERGSGGPLDYYEVALRGPGAGVGGEAPPTADIAVVRGAALRYAPGCLVWLDMPSLADERAEGTVVGSCEMPGGSASGEHVTSLLYSLQVMVPGGDGRPRAGFEHGVDPLRVRFRPADEEAAPLFRPDDRRSATDAKTARTPRPTDAGDVRIGGDDRAAGVSRAADAALRGLAAGGTSAEGGRSGAPSTDVVVSDAPPSGPAAAARTGAPASAGGRADRAEDAAGAVRGGRPSPIRPVAAEATAPPMSPPATIKREDVAIKREDTRSRMLDADGGLGRGTERVNRNIAAGGAVERLGPVRQDGKRHPPSPRRPSYDTANPAVAISSFGGEPSPKRQTATEAPPNEAKREDAGQPRNAGSEETDAPRAYLCRATPPRPTAAVRRRSPRSRAARGEARGRRAGTLPSRGRGRRLPPPPHRGARGDAAVEVSRIAGGRSTPTLPTAGGPPPKPSGGRDAEAGEELRRKIASAIRGFAKEAAAAAGSVCDAAGAQGETSPSARAARQNLESAWLSGEQLNEEALLGHSDLSSPAHTVPATQKEGEHSSLSASLLRPSAAGGSANTNKNDGADVLKTEREMPKDKDKVRCTPSKRPMLDCLYPDPPLIKRAKNGYRGRIVLPKNIFPQRVLIDAIIGEKKSRHSLLLRVTQCREIKVIANSKEHNVVEFVHETNEGAESAANIIFHYIEKSTEVTLDHLKRCTTIAIISSSSVQQQQPRDGLTQIEVGGTSGMKRDTQTVPTLPRTQTNQAPKRCSGASLGTMPSDCSSLTKPSSVRDWAKAEKGGSSVPGYSNDAKEAYRGQILIPKSIGQNHLQETVIGGGRSQHMQLMKKTGCLEIKLIPNYTKDYHAVQLFNESKKHAEKAVQLISGHIVYSVDIECRKGLRRDMKISIVSSAWKNRTCLKEADSVYVPEWLDASSMEALVGKGRDLAPMCNFELKYKESGIYIDVTGPDQHHVRRACVYIEHLVLESVEVSQRGRALYEMGVSTCSTRAHCKVVYQRSPHDFNTKVWMSLLFLPKDPRKCQKYVAALVGDGGNLSHLQEKTDCRIGMFGLRVMASGTLQGLNNDDELNRCHPYILVMADDSMKVEVGVHSLKQTFHEVK